MTTGRINQVCTVGPRPLGCSWRRGPDARSRALWPGLAQGPLALRRGACGLGPVQVASDARARLPAPQRSAPRAGPGAELAMRGAPYRRSLASPQPAPPSPGRPESTAAQTRAVAPRASASARSGRLRTPESVSPHIGTVRLRTATRTKACDPLATWCQTAHRCQNTDAPRPAAGQGLVPSAFRAGTLATARGPVTVRFAC